MPFEALRERLLRAGIAPRRVKRYLGELNDHLAELTAREVATGYDPAEAAIRARALLGSDDDLAKAWVSDPRLKSLTARVPWLVFGVIPPFALIIGFAVPILLLVVLAHVMGFLPGHAGGFGAAPGWLRALIHALPQALNLLVGPLLLAWLVLIAWRQRLNLVWPLFATVLLLLFFVRLAIVIGVAGHQSQIGLFSFLATLLVGAPRKSLGDLPAWQAAAQFILTLLPMAWLLYAKWKRQPQGAT